MVQAVAYRAKCGDSSPFPFGCAQGQGQNDNSFLIYSNCESAFGKVCTSALDSLGG